MNYTEEAQKALEAIFREKWMNDEDWSEYLIEIQKTPNFSIEEQAKALEEGVKKGLSIEYQIAVSKALFNI